jgi:hypothetical protein
VPCTKGLGMLEDYEKRFPGLLGFYSGLLGYYFAACPKECPEVAARMYDAFQSLGKDLEPALKEFQAEGLFSGRALSTRRQVELFWTSPLVTVFEAAVGYTPPPDVDLKRLLPEPVDSRMGLIRRRHQAAERVGSGELASGDLPYWQASMANCAPELYLWPYLPAEGLLCGFDLGSGWGRGVLCLGNFQRCEVTALDIQESQLDLLRRLAEGLGWLGLKTQVSTEPSFPDDSMDFGLSYAFLHLAEAEQLRSLLTKALQSLRTHAVFHIEFPTDSPMGLTMVSCLTIEQLLDLFHTTTVGDKLFQLVDFDPRIPDLFTFAVFRQGELPEGCRTGRGAHRFKPLAKRILIGDSTSRRRR